MKSFYLLFLFLTLASCSTPDAGVTQQKMNNSTNYNRDMVIRVNGITREGSIAMPLLPKNTIHVWSANDMDTFVMETCGGNFDKRKEWAVPVEVKSGLIGWGKKKIDSPREAEITIDATDFNEVGICPLNFYAISKSDAKKSEAYVTWQTPFYKIGGYLICNLEKRNFQGVEVCSTATGSFTKIVFDEVVIVSPKKGCEINSVIRDVNGKVTGVKEVNEGKEFDFQAHSGVCNYEFLSKTSELRGNYHVYGYDETIIR